MTKKLASGLHPQGHLAIQLKSTCNFIDIAVGQIDVDQIDQLIINHFFVNVVDKQLGEDIGLVVELHKYDLHKLLLAIITIHEDGFKEYIFKCKVMAENIRIILKDNNIEIYDHRTSIEKGLTIQKVRSKDERRSDN